jgi:hypothetical protein
MNDNYLGTLDCMASHYDGAHWGLADWYPEIEAGIVDALSKGPEVEWTTGWYSSKKEIASAKITCYGDGQLEVTASVSDDFDTEGYGDKLIPFTQDLSVIRQAIYDAWDEAEANRKDNAEYVMFTVKRCEPGDWDNPVSWVETFLFDPTGMQDCPPGDNYFEWGWQNESIIEPIVRDTFEKAIQAWYRGDIILDADTDRIATTEVDYPTGHTKGYVLSIVND